MAPWLTSKIRKSLQRDPCKTFKGRAKHCFPSLHDALVQIRKLEQPLVAYECPKHDKPTWHIGRCDWTELATGHRR